MKMPWPCTFTRLRKLFSIWPVLFCLMLISPQLLGQRLDFSHENPEEFLSKINYLTEGLALEEKAEAQMVIDSFSALWLSERLSAERREMVISTLNQIQTLRLRPWPEQAIYFKGVLAVLNTLEPKVNFDAWHKSFQSMMNIQQQRRLLRYWESSYDLFKNNVIFSSNVVKWVLQNNNFYLAYSENTPKVIFRETNLKCYSQGDSTVVYNTRGEIYPLDDKLTGQGGKITWQRARLSGDSVWADLSNYSINLTSSRWEADSVTFHNRYFFR